MALLKKGTLTKQPIRIINTIYNADRTIAEGNVVLEISATISENYQKSASITTYPVEEGTNLAEHAMVNSSTISISAVTSDASLTYFNFLEEGFVDDLLDNIRGSVLGQFFGGQSRSQRVYNTLETWADQATPLVVKSHFRKDGYFTGGSETIAGVSTQAKNISPWIIESLNIPRDRNTGSSIRFEMTLRQISLVTLSRGLAGFSGLLGERTLSANIKSTNAEAKNPAPIARTEAPLRDNAAAQGRPVASGARTILGGR